MDTAIGHAVICLQAACEGSWKMGWLSSHPLDITALVLGSRLSQANGEEKRDKMKASFLSSKSSAGVELFWIKLENLPWQLQAMSLFCCKSSQLPNGTAEPELMGLSTPWKEAAAVIGGGNLTSLIIGCQMKWPGVMFYCLRMDLAKL